MALWVAASSSPRSCQLDDADFQGRVRIGCGPDSAGDRTGTPDTISTRCGRADEPGPEVFYVRAASAGFSIWTSLKQLLQSVRPALNLRYLRHHLHFGETATHATAWRDVFQLVPNAALSLTAGGCSWRFEPWRKAACRNASVEHPAVLLRQAIPDSATSVVLELSGGTDSTAIAYALSGRHDVLAITWADPLAPGSSDIEHAKRIAGKLGFEHRVATLSPGGFSSCQRSLSRTGPAYRCS
ncbi:hypothetical protein DM292_07325 [Stutzerimonas frequens]|uniref:asparagine synthase-related protein n=1 Tax=Stutzerimonas frequens TaxID=2968969 RepID=UPI000D7D586C|nr:hypothetical protein DM292_07325 [Stutzerimonas frequens]